MRYSVLISDFYFFNFLQEFLNHVIYYQQVNVVLIQVLQLIFAEMCKQLSVSENFFTKMKLPFTHCLLAHPEIVYCRRWKNTGCDVVPVICWKGL